MHNFGVYLKHDDVIEVRNIVQTATMKRLSASIPDKLYQRLEKLADHEGRSISNLVAYLLEQSIDQKLDGYIKTGEERPNV